MQRRLNRGGIWTTEQLWNTQPKQLRKLWGSVEGEKFWYRLHGHDVPDAEHGKVMVGHSRVLDPAHRHPDMAKQIARRLTIKAAQRLRRYGLLASRFSLSVRTTEGEKWGCEIRLAPVCDNLSFIHTLNKLWIHMMREFHPWRLKKISVIMHDLRKPELVTDDLFSLTAKKQHQRKVSTALSAGMDALNKKFGPNTCHFGICPNTLSEYVGTKIAFARIPDQEEFWE